MNYWLVGAALSGFDHQNQNFVKNSYWFLGWEEHEQPDQFKKAKMIQIGDRIAIKRLSKKLLQE